jgi:hypothetical protein
MTYRNKLKQRLHTYRIRRLLDESTEEGGRRLGDKTVDRYEQLLKERETPEYPPSDFKALHAVDRKRILDEVTYITRIPGLRRFRDVELLPKPKRIWGRK